MTTGRTRDECRGSGRRDARSDNDGRETHDTSVDEPSAGELVYEELRAEFAHSVCAFWGSNGIRGDNLGLRRTLE